MSSACNCSHTPTSTAAIYPCADLAQDHQRLHALVTQALALSDEFTDICSDPDWLENKKDLLAFAQNMRLLREDLRLYEEATAQVIHAQEAPTLRLVDWA